MSKRRLQDDEVLELNTADSKRVCPENDDLDEVQIVDRNGLRIKMDNALGFDEDRVTGSDSDRDIEVIQIEDDEGVVTVIGDDMNDEESRAIDALLDQDNFENFGALPSFDRSAWLNVVAKLKKNHADAYQKINFNINNHYTVNLQNEATLRWKEMAREGLQTATRKVFPSATLYAVGSTMNGCGSFNSDMDLCAVIDEDELQRTVKLTNPKRLAVNALRKIRNSIGRTLPSSKRTLVIPAVVPILQVSFIGVHDGLDVDMNINNIAGIYNTHLIHHYSRQDERFPALCLLIKHWAFNANVNSAQDGTFNSYSLILLVLHFMQAACVPAVLPNLQKVSPEVFSGQVPVNALRFFSNEVVFESENRQDYATLLIGFFHYYSNFDFDKWAISIRKACVFPKELLPQSTQQRYKIFIEEPFDHNNTARCVRGDGYELIKAAIRGAYRELTGPKPSLTGIGISLPSQRQ